MQLDPESSTNWLYVSARIQGSDWLFTAGASRSPAIAQSTAGLANGQKQLPAERGTSGDVLQTWSGGNLGLRGDGINISTSAIVVMFLHWQISVSCESKLPWGGGNGKVKDMQGENPGRLRNENNTGRGRKK